MTVSVTVLVALILVGSSLFFVALWAGISVMIAAASGYRSLLQFRSADARTGDPLPRAHTVHLGNARYRGHMLTLTASRDGLGMHVHRMFVGHPDLRIPWDRVEIAASDRRGVDVVLDGRVHMRVPAEIADAIAAARPRR